MSDPFEELLWRIGEPACRAALAVEWADSQAALPVGPLSHLLPETVISSMLYGGFTEEQARQAADFATQLNADPLLREFAWHTRWRIFESKDDHWFAGWPELNHLFGENAGLFYLLAGVAGIPLIRAFHREMGIEEAVTRETVRETQTFSQGYAMRSGGLLGVSKNQVFWIRHYTREKYFRLGRFEFWLQKYRGELLILRNRFDGRVAALAPPGWRFDSHGDRPADDAPPTPQEWVSALREDARAWTGQLIHPSGRGLRATRTYLKSEWEKALQPGDWVLDMHIPHGGGMYPEAVRESFRNAAEFFPRHFPQTPPIAYQCHSWIYNPYLGDLLPAHAHLVENLGDAYLVPIPEQGEDGLEFMFFQSKFNPATAPRQTSLQRAILDYIAAGGHWRGGAMFYLMDDLPALGTRVYHRMWEPYPQTAA